MTIVNLADARLEREILAARRALDAAELDTTAHEVLNAVAVLQAWNHLTELINQRSPALVQKMERERGLR